MSKNTYSDRFNVFYEQVNYCIECVTLLVFNQLLLILKIGE
jgi:hypothetical protein